MGNHNQLHITPTVATILHSYNCTAACQHCCFDSHPGIKQRLSLDQILHFIDEAAKFPSMKLIVFSGGECFLLGKELDIAVAHATEHKLATRCVTNGYWAKDYQHALERLATLKEAGLRELNISTGDYHQMHVPQANVVNGALAAVNLGIGMVIMVELQKERKVTADKLRQDERIANLIKTDAAKSFYIIESPWMPMSHSERIDQNKDSFINRYNVHQRKGCKSVLTTLVATPHNKLGICCGLSREKIPELNIDLPENFDLQKVYKKNSTDFIKIWLFVEGPERILAWAATKDPTILWEDRYAHNCHACLAMFQDEKVKTAIFDHYQEKVDEVLLRYALLAKSGQASPELMLRS